MKRITYLVYLLLFTIAGYGQKAIFSSPVKFPIILNGNFGEIRANHFHTGIDIKTNGEKDLAVLSVEDGFVSRISVSPTGYGNALYVEHTNGYTSVYGHLEAFAKPIADYVKKQQYEQKVFELDIKPDANLFPVKRGEKIAVAGNSGSSAGPHLHFEIRKTETEHAINPLYFDFNINDNTKPIVGKLYVYPLSNDSHVENKITKQKYDLTLFGNAYHLKSTTPVLNLFGEIGFGIDAIDYFDGNWSKCGIYQMELWIDNQLINSFELDEIDFEYNRYINSHIDYEESMLTGTKSQKCFIDPGNKLDIYKQTINRGIFNFSDGQKHNVKILFFDVNMNSQEINFDVQSTVAVKHAEENTVNKFLLETDNNFSNDKVEINIPKGNLYTDINFLYQEYPNTRIGYSPIFRLHNSTTPIHKKIEVRLKAVNLPEQLQEKAIVAIIDQKTNRMTSLGGHFDNGWVKTESKYFGDMLVAVDTINPTIRSLSIKDNTLMEADRLRFKIDDDLSGIASYDGFIDGVWVLFEYDAKNSLISYRFDENIEKGKKHKIELLVKDIKGNYKIYEAGFLY